MSTGGNAALPSALSSFITRFTSDPPPAESSKSDGQLLDPSGDVPSGASSSPFYALAIQIQYTLQHAHDWTSLTLHTQSPVNGKALTRPLISGCPPQPIYVHPDDQVKLLANGKDGKLQGVQKPEEENRDDKTEREWVLPTSLAEKWTLRRFAEVFDSIEEVPPDKNHGINGSIDTDQKTKSRTGGKRILLAVAGDDSSIVYYIVHEGIVKPRQN